MTLFSRASLTGFGLFVLAALVVAVGIAYLIDGAATSPQDIAATLVALQLAVGAIVVALNIQAARYLLDYWHDSRTETHPERSWLLRALFLLAATILGACAWLLLSITITSIWGPQYWLRPVNTALLIGVLTVPIRLVREFRRRERAAADAIRVDGMPGPDG